MNAIEDKAMPEVMSIAIPSGAPSTPWSVNTLPLRTAVTPPSDAAVFQLISVASTNLPSW